MSPSLRIAATILLLALQPFLSFSAPLHAQVNCPNVRSTTVDPHSVEVGPIDDCSVDTTIFGWHFAAHGPKCPAELDVYPSHGECQGALSPGTRCDLGGVLPIDRRKCECTYGFLWSHFYKPRCDCEYSGVAGTIDDFHTFSCWDAS